MKYARETHYKIEISKSVTNPAIREMRLSHFITDEGKVAPNIALDGNGLSLSIYPSAKECIALAEALLELAKQTQERRAELEAQIKAKTCAA